MLNYRKHSRTNAAKTNHKVMKPKMTTKKIEECNGGALNAAQCDPLWLPITDVIC